MSNVYIAGSGGFARETRLLLLQQGKILWKKPVYTSFAFGGYLTDDETQWGKEITGGIIAGSIENINDRDACFIPGIGSPSLREKLVNRALARGWSPVTLECNSLWKGTNIDIGHGCVLCSNSSLTCDISIGNYVNVNLNCTIGHDSVLEDYVNLSPHCTISGHVTLKRSVDLGSAATILPGVTVGEGSVIGAGAVVTKDVEPYSLMVGIPAKKIKDLK